MIFFSFSKEQSGFERLESISISFISIEKAKNADIGHPTNTKRR